MGFFQLLRASLGAVLLLCLTLEAAAQEQQGATLTVRNAAGGGSKELPLISEQLLVTIEQGHASTRFEHQFQNESAESLEGQYAIFLGTIATATGFAYFNGEEKIVGEIFEKDVATQIYNEVTGQNADPGLLEQVGEGGFSFKVSPIMPGEKKRITLETASLLQQKGNVFEYQAPLGKAARDAGVGSIFLIRDERTITKVWSPTHSLQVEEVHGGKQAKVTGLTAKKSDTLVIRYEVSEPDFFLSTTLHRDPGQDAYLQLSIGAPPQVQTKQEPRDVTLVVDRSGSMMGAPLAAAIAATKGVIQKLRDEDRINIITFDDGVDGLFSAPRPAKDVRREALTYADAISSGGGTDIALALREAIARQKGADRQQVVLFLTDGQSDSQAALLEAKKAGPAMRLYTVGIGSGVDRPLLTQIAQNNRGIFTYVANEANLERDVDKLYTRIGSPVLSDLKLSVKGASIQRSYPRVTSDLFEQDRLSMSLRLRPIDAASKTATLSLSGVRNGVRETFTKTVSLAPEKHTWVARHWASARVDDLLGQMSEKGETPELKTEAIELALSYDLVTRYTSFLAIPESEVTDSVRGTLEQERSRRAQLLAKHKDAAALSRQLMPPGDPVISIAAPRNAHGVTAIFPFGLELELAFNDSTDRWEGRFLVPHDVVDGKYTVHLIIVGRSMQLSTSDVEYEIDSRAPAVDVQTTPESFGATIRVVADEALREVRVAWRNPSASSSAPALCKAHAGSCPMTRQNATEFSTTVHLPPGDHELLIVTTDLARNETTTYLRVHVEGADSGC